MSFIGRTIGKITGAQDQADAAGDASRTQAAAAGQGIDSSNQALAAYQQLLAPYVNAGPGALSGQQNLIGLNGVGAQQSAISGIQGGPQFQAMQMAGQNAILQNASATGGLRGGNTQAALAQFSPALLSSLIQQQYSNLGGLTTLGANSAAGVGGAGLQTSSNIANLLTQQGAATAGGQLAAGGVGRAGFGDLLSIAGIFTGGKKSGGL